jgi:hypothetical protein
MTYDRSNLPRPTVMGRLCLWSPPRAPPTFATYEAGNSELLPYLSFHFSYYCHVLAIIYSICAVCDLLLLYNTVLITVMILFGHFSVAKT